MIVFLAFMALCGCQGVSTGKSSAQTTTTPTGDLVLSSTTIAFGNVVVGKTATQTVTASNGGNASLTISSATASSPQFSVTSPSLPLTIAAGQKASLSIAFSPSAATGSSGSISVVSDASDNAVSLSLSGIGINPGQLSSNPSSVSFVNVEVGNTQTQPATLMNSGGTSLTLSQANVSGPGFSLSGLTLPLSLAAGQSATFSVAFAPQSAENATGNIAFSSDASNSTMNLPLSGAALVAGSLTATPTSLSFGNVQVGTSQGLSVTLTNTDDSSVTISQAAATGPGFSLATPTLPLTLTAGQSVNLTITFAAQSPGIANGNATITSNAPNPTLTIPLVSTAVSPAPATYYGLNLHPEVLTGQVPWPDFSFGAIRLWNTNTAWTDLEPSNGSYDWSNLDGWLNLGQSKGITNFVYTFGKGTPSWISSNPNDATCTKATATVSTNGQCDPPSDVDAGDGSFKAFVTALVQHAAGRIAAWECINEPDVPEQWTGTMAQTLTMCTDMYNIVKANDPTALVTTPAPVAYSGQTSGSWMTSYLQTGGGTIADVIAFHGYEGATLAQDPEVINTIVQAVTSAASSNSASSKPVWDTEMSWDDNTNLPDPDLEAAFVARVYLLQWSLGVSRFYWFQYGADDVGTLWTSTGGDNEAATAYGVVYSWMVGATLTSPCTANGTVWTCNFTNSSGAQTQAVWDASQTCSNGSCTTSSYTPNSQYSKYEDLAGNTTQFTSGSAIQIGAKPILLEQ